MMGCSTWGLLYTIITIAAAAAAAAAVESREFCSKSLLGLKLQTFRPALCAYSVVYAARLAVVQNISNCFISFRPEYYRAKLVVIRVIYVYHAPHTKTVETALSYNAITRI